MKQLDDTNKEIIKQLLDGRKAYSAIASELNITENTVRARVNKMIEEGILQITGLVNPEAIAGLQVVIFGVKLKTLDLEKKAKEFLHLKGVISAVVVTGHYDLIIQVILNSEEHFTLLDFFKRELCKISDISDVETFVVYQSHNYNIPYIL